MTYTDLDLLRIPVSITSIEALTAVNLAHLRQYLEWSGWREVESRMETVYYEKVHEGKSFLVHFLPAPENAMTNILNMRHTFDTLSQVEQRSALVIWRDVVQWVNRVTLSNQGRIFDLQRGDVIEMKWRNLSGVRYGTVVDVTKDSVSAIDLADESPHFFSLNYLMNTPHLRLRALSDTEIENMQTTIVIDQARLLDAIFDQREAERDS